MSQGTGQGQLTVRLTSDGHDRLEKRRGRPRAVEVLTPVTAWLPSSYVAKLDAYARKHDVPVSAAVRQLLILRLNIPTE